MGMLPDEAYEEYREIYKREFGKDLTDKELVLQANSLITPFRIFGKNAKKHKSYKQSKDKRRSRKSIKKTRGTAKRNG